MNTSSYLQNTGEPSPSVKIMGFPKTLSGSSLCSNVTVEAVMWGKKVIGNNESCVGSRRLTLSEVLVSQHTSGNKNLWTDERSMAWAMRKVRIYTVLFKSQTFSKLCNTYWEDHQRLPITSDKIYGNFFHFLVAWRPLTFQGDLRIKHIKHYTIFLVSKKKIERRIT